MLSYPPDIERRMQWFFASLTPRDRRRYAAIEAIKMGHGGMLYIAELLDCDPKTIRRGLEEIEELMTPKLPYDNLRP